MNPVTLVTSCLLVLGLVVVTNAQSFAQDITGEWINAAKDTKILVYKGRKDTKKVRYNEDHTKYYAKVTWNSSGEVQKNKKIMVQFSPQGGNLYKFGKIYHPRNKREYEGYLQLREDGSLKVRKFVNKSYVGTTEIWVRTTE